MARTYFLYLLIIGMIAPQASRAESNCSYLLREYPGFFEETCKSSSKGSGSSGGGSTFTEGFNVSPAALPTETTPYGLEVISSVLHGRWNRQVPTFAIVKGFKKFGTGVSTSSQNIFYGNDLVQRELGPPELKTFNPSETAKTSLPNLNVGTSVSLIKSDGGLDLGLGITIRHNQNTATWGGGSGLLFSWKNLNFGAGFTRERISTRFAPVTFTSAFASLKLFLFEFEFLQLQNFGGPNLSPVRIGTMTFFFKKMILTAAVRELNYLSRGMIYQQHYAIQFRFSNRLSLGLLHNYIPGALSVAGQLYL